MGYIVLDLEWNQSPYGKASSVKGMPFEIIEIGAVKLNDSYEIVDTFHRIIKPVIYDKIHYRIRPLISLTEDDLKKGVSFKEAITDFDRWIDKDVDYFCTWGSTDLFHLQSNIEHFKCKFKKFNKPLFFLDIQKLFAYSQDDVGNLSTLKEAAEKLGLVDDKHVFHSAIDDAYYTARVMQCIDMEKLKDYYSVDLYQVPGKKDNIHMYFPTYSKHVYGGFKDSLAVMDDKNVTMTVCAKCNKKMPKKIRWFASNGHTYYCLACCKEHGFVKGKIKIHTDRKKNYYAYKVLVPIDEEETKKVFERREEIRKKRRRTRAKRKERLDKENHGNKNNR